LSSLEQEFAGGTGNLTEGLAYDANNDITTRTRSNTGFSFNGYASVNRSYTANALNQYVTAGSATFSYDANGNLTGDGTNTYGYDAENRLIGASTSGGTTLTYDPLGRLFQTSSATYGTTQYLYDGQHVIAEYNGSGTLLRRFFWGPNADEPVMQDEGGALNCTGTRFLQSDELGSVVAAADCWGNLQTPTNTYDEYGIPGSGNWAATSIPARPGSQTLGCISTRRGSTAPRSAASCRPTRSGMGMGPNWYAYVHNNPVNGTDPTGLDSPCWPGSCGDEGGDGSDGGGFIGQATTVQGITVTPQSCLPQNGCFQSAALPTPTGGGSQTLGGGGNRQPANPQSNTKSKTRQVYSTPKNPCSEAGNAPDPSYYADNGLYIGVLGLFSFHRGGYYDAQQYGGSRAYGNYAYGVYLAAAGLPLPVALAGADLIC
jgi:YD repeat-containing protein